MPEVKEIAKHYASNPDFAILSVSLDGRDTAQRLVDTVRKDHVNYPVLHAGGDDGWNDGNFGWSIHGVPSAYIIDPQGNIFADVYPTTDLIEDFDWLMAQHKPLPPVGLSVSGGRDGDSIKLNVQLSSPQHLPLDVKVSVTKIKKVYNPEYDTEGTGEPNDYDYIDLTDQLNLGFSADFGEFGETSRDIEIPLDDDATLYSYNISANVPGMGELHDGEGLSVGTYGYVRTEQPKQEEDQEQDE